MAASYPKAGAVWHKTAGWLAITKGPVQGVTGPPPSNGIVTMLCFRTKASKMRVPKLTTGEYVLDGKG